MEFKASSGLIYVQSKANKKGTGFYIELADEDYNKYRFYSRREFKFDKGQKVVPVLEVYPYSGRLQFRLLDLEVV